MQSDSLDSKTLLEKAYERFLPALGYLHSSIAGFAASVTVFVTWVLRRGMSESERVSLNIEKDADKIVELEKKLRELEMKKKYLSEALKENIPEFKKRIAEATLRQIETQVESIQEEIELLSMRILAIQKLLELKEIGILKKIEKAVNELEKGKADKEAYKILQQLEYKWRNKELTKTVIERILSGA